MARLQVSHSLECTPIVTLFLFGSPDERELYVEISCVQQVVQRDDSPKPKEGIGKRSRNFPLLIQRQLGSGRMLAKKMMLQKSFDRKK